MNYPNLQSYYIKMTKSADTILMLRWLDLTSYQNYGNEWRTI